MSYPEPGITRPPLAVAFISLTAVTYSIARYRMLTGSARYDDEGYMLMSLKSFLEHGCNYDNFTGYGPFYYGFWGGAVRVGHLGVMSREVVPPGIGEPV